MNANPGRAVEGCTGATPGAPSTGLSASAVADELAGTGGDVSGKVPPNANVGCALAPATAPTAPSVT